MPETSGFFFGLQIIGFEFGPLETLLLVVAIATALVSLAELIRLSRREQRQLRVANLRGAIAVGTEIVRVGRIPWYGRLGEIIAKTPLVGVSEQRRLAAKLVAAGIGGPGRVATLIACRFMFAVAASALVWLAIDYLDLLADKPSLRYFAVAFGLIIGWRIPDFIVTRLGKRRTRRLEMGFPDALDMLVICAEAGLGLEQAIGHVARDMRLAMPEVAEEFAIVEAEMRVLEDRRVALENLAERTGIASLRGLISILNQSVRFGTPLSEALRQLTAEARLLRISRIEEQAGRLAVTLLFPVMAFILPCLFLIIVGPIALRAVDMFSQLMEMP